MKSSKQSQREAKTLFRSSLANGVPDEERVRTAMRKLVELKPRGYLGILEHLRKLIELTCSGARREWRRQSR